MNLEQPRMPFLDICKMKHLRHAGLQPHYTMGMMQVPFCGEDPAVERHLGAGPVGEVGRLQGHLRVGLGLPGPGAVPPEATSPGHLGKDESLLG